MKQQITITSNVITLPIVRDGISTGEIKLPVDDTQFLGNFYALLPKLEQHRATLAAALRTETENPADALAALDALWCSLRADIDTVFGAGTSALVFGEACSLGLVQQFFEGVAAAMQTARSSKIERYTKPISAALV
ncbi:MAG: hypothetical protein RR395_02465 [Ruthenibacterium sp.]